MKKLVEVLGGFERIDILEEKKLLKMDVRYIGTDYESNVDIYEELATGELFGKSN